MDGETVDQYLEQLMQPFDPSVCALSVELAPLVAAAIEGMLESMGPHEPEPLITSSKGSNKRRRRCSTTAAAKIGKHPLPVPRLLRKRTSLLASEAVDRQRRMLVESFRALLCDTATSDSRKQVPAIGDIMALLGGVVRDRLLDRTDNPEPRTFKVTGEESRKDDAVVEFVASSAEGSEAVVGVYTTREDAERPFSTGLVEYLIAGMNRHARTQLSVRHAWALVLAPGAMRICLIESDAIHVSRAHNLDTPEGRYAMASFYTAMCLAEAWRLGADPTMVWRADIGRWEIECPSGDDSAGAGRRHRRTTRNSLAVQQAATVVYGARTPLFVADTFFGRFTRCFPVSMTPDGPLDQVLKDAWQLGPDSDEDDDDAHVDEIGVLRHIRRSLDAARPATGAVYPRITCGGTVRINTERDTSRLVLGELNAYGRWTKPHGVRREAESGRMQRLHRRMVTGPIGIPIQTLGTEQEVITVLADAMQSHASILRHAGILHRDISLNNIMAARMPNGELRGMLIDFDHAVDALAERNRTTPGNVGTGPFMSISNLEGLDVARTAVDDWESLLCLLFCLAANGPAAMDELARLFGHVNAQGVADMKRELFASPRALDYAIARYLNPAYHTIIRTIRALYMAAFQHARCQGTQRIFLRGNRNVDPVLRRAQYADDIQARCLGALTAIAREIRSMSSLSDHLASISHDCYDSSWHAQLCTSTVPMTGSPDDPATATEEAAQRAVAERLEGLISAVAETATQGQVPGDAAANSSNDGDTTAVSYKSQRTLLGRTDSCASPPLSATTTPPPPSMPPMTAKSEGQARSIVDGSNVSLSTLLREASQSNHSRFGYCGHSTSTTLTDIYSVRKDANQHGPSHTNYPASTDAAQIYRQEKEQLLRTKRKAKEEEQADSPRTKRRKMIHQDDNPSHFELSPVHPSHRRALAFGSPVVAHSPLRSPYASRRNRHHHRPPPIRSPIANDHSLNLTAVAPNNKIRRKLF
ncbi:hypothetical protein EV175_003496 [Coemansia sp. RSA 1933]|nr:hypothetical protein EV175_003496 [Coemansia sp. RSA 1933]